jgi:cytochrome c oxidase subunit 2
VNGQSVLVTAGPDAAALATLSWVMFIGGTAILAIVAAITLAALFGGGRVRGAIASRNAILLGGVAFPVVVLTALLVYALGIGVRIALPGAEPPLRVEMIGHQFWWEVRYPDALPDGPVVTANEVRIPVGRDVVLHVSSADVIHSVWIPALHGKIDMIPGRVNTRRIRASKPGVLRGQCTEYCGTQHAMMAFMVVAEPPEAYDAWLARQRLPAAEPPPGELAFGREVFGAAGCGGCHAVRGTEWTARLGPDLTHVGSRLTLGAGVLANHRSAIAGWVAGSQDIKPGNRMPSFATALDGPELRAVSAWLDSLR